MPLIASGSAPRRDLEDVVPSRQTGRQHELHFRFPTIPNDLLLQDG